MFDEKAKNIVDRTCISKLRLPNLLYIKVLRKENMRDSTLK